VSRYEQPKYTVDVATEDYEIRLYDSYLAAETTVVGGFEAGGSTAFRRLAGFIFGKNSAAKKMNMTVPVTRQAVGEDQHVYRFVMERSYAEEDLPSPDDESIAIVRVPAGHYAARSYRGSRDEQRHGRAEDALLAALKRDGIEVTGPPVAAVYSGPMTPPPLRRNEVLVPVSWTADRG